MSLSDLFQEVDKRLDDQRSAINDFHKLLSNLAVRFDNLESSQGDSVKYFNERCDYAAEHRLTLQNSVNDLAKALDKSESYFNERCNLNGTQQNRLANDVRELAAKYDKVLESHRIDLNTLNCRLDEVVKDVKSIKTEANIAHDRLDFHRSDIDACVSELNQVNEKMSEQGSRIRDHNKIIDSCIRVDDQQARRLSEHEERLDSHSQWLSELDDRAQSCEEDSDDMSIDNINADVIDYINNAVDAAVSNDDAAKRVLKKQVAYDLRDALNVYILDIEHGS